MLLNSCKDIGLAVNIGNTKNMEIVRHLGTTASISRDVAIIKEKSENILILILYWQIKIIFTSLF